MPTAAYNPLASSEALHLLIIALGSAGDVHPFAGLGRALHERGHRVEVVTNPYFQDLIETLDLKFVPVGTAEQFLEATQDPRLWHPIEGFRLVARWLMLEQMPAIYELLTERYEPGRTVVIAPFSAFGARFAQEKLGVPLVTVHLQPGLLRSVYDAPEFPLPRLLTGWKPLARIVHRGAFALLDRLLIEPALAPGINALRATLGLAPVHGILAGWVHSPELVIGLFPDWFGCPQPDWPAHVRLTGFPLFDESSTREMPEELARFLDAGEPPVVFTAGSAMRQAAGHFRMAAEACETLGCRGALITRYAEQLPASLPAGVRHFEYIPFSQILPRAAAFVHHGGIGTTAQAFAAGVPQFVTPFNHDQPDNAERVRRLGAGYVTPAGSLTTRRMVHQLRRLLESSTVAGRCRELASQINGQQAISDSCDLIEQFAARRLERPARAQAS
jgi:UDP:flavonoid glycosyltransferase YjiC (YdhE family)